MDFAAGVADGEISIHAPRMGSDSAVSSTNLRSSPFQSTLPGWGATVGWSLMVVTCMDFNPRSPAGERLAHRLSNVSLMTLFQSTLPGWGATKDGTRHPCPPPISIHAPRMGSDLQSGRYRGGDVGISIHAPRMGSDSLLAQFRQFNVEISIHAPRMGSDRENGHLRPRYGQNHPFSTLIVSQIVVDVLGTVRKSQKTPAH